MKVLEIFVFLLIIFGFQNFDSADAVNIQCEYYLNTYDILGKIEGCEVTNQLDITSRQTAIIDSASGMEKQSGKSNNDVVNLYVFFKNIHYFPRNLENIFPNLKRINFGDNKIKELHQSDLKSLKNLMTLELYNNLIEVLEENLFDYNPELVYINLNSNKIAHIAENVFSNVPKLTYLHLFSNPCINIDAVNNRTAVMEVNKAANAKCISAEFTTLTKDLKLLENEIKGVDSTAFTAFHKKTLELENKFSNSKFRNFGSLKARINLLSDVKVFTTWRIINDSEKIINITLEGITNKITDLGICLKNSTDQIMEKSDKVQNEVTFSMSNKMLNISSKLDSEFRNLKTIIANTATALELTKHEKFMNSTMNKLEQNVASKCTAKTDATFNQLKKTMTEMNNKLKVGIKENGQEMGNSIVNELKLKANDIAISVKRDICVQINATEQGMARIIKDLSAKTADLQTLILDKQEDLSIKMEKQITEHEKKMNVSTKELTSVILDLKKQLEQDDSKNKNEISNNTKDLDTKISELTENTRKLNNKISELESMLKSFIHASSIFQYNLDQIMQIQDSKIERSGELHDYWKTALIITCFFLATALLFILFLRVVIMLIYPNGRK